MNDDEIGSLFSGIGGIELGYEREGFRTKWFVENDGYCQRVLAKNFPGVPIYGDIQEIDFRELEPVDILTGGFPCQDISKANPKGKGIAGERSGLWSHFAEAIGILRPRYAVIENVPMLANRGLDVVLRDIAENGYDAEWFTLRASDFGALHQRERLFVIAYPFAERLERIAGERLQTIERRERTVQPNNEISITSDINSVGWEEYRQLRLREGERSEHFDGTEIKAVNYPDINGIGFVEVQTEKGAMERRNETLAEDRPRFITDDFRIRIQRFAEESLQGEYGFSWCKDVRRVEDLCGRPDIPEPLFRGGRDGLPYWVDRIRCLGNAVVPQVAQFIARRIREIDKNEYR